MLRSKKLWLALGLLAVTGILVACAPQTVVETVIVEGTPRVVEVTPTAGAMPEEEKTLVVCEGQEPDTLYIYGGSMLAASHVQQAIYDGPIDNNTFGYQPIILQKLPSIEDGDAVVQSASVSAGDSVIADNGDLVTLEEGMMVRPAGCRASDCAVAYDGGSLDMDQMQVTFKLLEGLTWSDGEPLKASDSVYSFHLGLDPDSPTPSRFTFERTASYEAPDDITTVWTGLPGFIDATYFTNFFTPLPEHAWSGMSAADLVESEEASRTPMGWGPFVITEWVAGSHITTVKNENYFRASEGLPKVDSVVFRFIGENPNASIAALLAGECDILTQDTQLDSQSQLLIELEAEGQLVPTFVTGTVWEHVDFGITPVESYDRPNFFGDVRMRRAVAMCLDRQAVVDSILFGRSIVIHDYIPPDHPLYNPDVTQYPFDPEAAQALMDEVGWVDDDGDPATPRVASGVDGVPDGTTLSFKWQSTTAELRVNYMQVFQEQLAQCGIALTIENLPAGEYFADGPEGPVFGRHFDLGSFAWLTGVEPPCSLYLTSEIPSDANGWAGQNDPGWSDAEFDQACNAALQSLPGTPEYEQFHKQAQAIFADQLPVVPLFLRTKLAAYRPEVTGFIMDQTENSEMFNIENFGFAAP